MKKKGQAGSNPTVTTIVVAIIVALVWLGASFVMDKMGKDAAQEGIPTQAQSQLPQEERTEEGAGSEQGKEAEGGSDKGAEGQQEKETEGQGQQTEGGEGSKPAASAEPAQSAGPTGKKISEARHV